MLNTKMLRTIEAWNTFVSNGVELGSVTGNIVNIRRYNDVFPWNLTLLEEMQGLAEVSRIVMNTRLIGDIPEAAALFGAAHAFSDTFVGFTKTISSQENSAISRSLLGQLTVLQLQQAHILKTLFPQRTSVEPGDGVERTDHPLEATSLLEERAEGILEEAVKETLPDTNNEIERWLLSVHPTFFDMWNGAKHAFASAGPDYPRHIMISLRTLLENLMKRLAPDDDVRAWSQDPQWYRDQIIENGPSGKGRISYVCRTLRSSSFAKVLDAAVDVALRIWQYLNRVHVQETSIPRQELQLLLGYFEVTLQTLMRASQEGESH